MNVIIEKFRGSFEQLKETLKDLIPQNDWTNLTENHKQVKHISGAIINWYPSTGSIHIQGDDKSIVLIQEQITKVLSGQEANSILIQEIFKEKIDETVGHSHSSKLLGFRYEDTELVFGVVSAVGTESRLVIGCLEERLRYHNYDVVTINVSSDVIGEIIQPRSEYLSEIDRINHFMDLGNEIREQAEDNSILALGVASEIFRMREKDDQGHSKPQQRKVFIINSLKHPAEIERLREIYMDGFYLVGIAEDENRRIRQLERDNKSKEGEAELLIARDRDESKGHGQHTRDTFQLADFFISLNGNIDKTRADINRIIGLIFGNPYLTPTFDEYAMFMAFTSALRSADLSRQVGAVVAKNNEIIATGANDCPRPFGGLYWPIISDGGEISDVPDGRDHTRGVDSNKDEQQKIIQNILDNLPEGVDKEVVRTALEKSKLKDITEYGRIVHAEMEALMFCARNNISARRASLYCTTFPCHNCAKHIIASGIERVFYIEPYPKSKAFDFYSDAVTSNPKIKDKVMFLPFVGVGPRRYFDLFSINLSSGHPIIRKNKDGTTVNYLPENSKVRMQMLPWSYLEKEAFASRLLKEFLDSRNI